MLDHALLALAVFVASALIDYLAIRFHRARERGERFTAGNWSVLYGLVAAISYVAVARTGLWLIAPECLGFWVGTVLAIKPVVPVITPS